MADDGAVNMAYLSLGSNIEPEVNLPAAVRELTRCGRVTAVSHVWQSPPLGNPDQPDYLNAAVLLETPLSAAMLKETAISAIETGLGRVRTSDKNAPRTIDIDIMFFNRDVLACCGRTIPDPEVMERPFVAIPLAEIAPDYLHPLNGITLAEIAGHFDLEAAGMKQRADIQIAPSIN